MRLITTGFVLLGSLLGLLAATASDDIKQAKDDTKVVQGTDDNVWVSGDLMSNKAKVGDAADRKLVVKVKKDQLVRFEVTGNQHGVIFENGKTQLEAGIFEVVKNTGELDLKDPSDQATDPLFLPDYYKRDEAKLTLKRGRGPIITIKIKKLEPGLTKGILFGCNPHSKPPTNSDVKMLGVLVLEE